MILLLPLLASLLSLSAVAKLVEIDSSILVSGSSDYVIVDGTSRCLGMVERAKKLTQSSVMVVPTLFWVDEGHDAEVAVNSQSNVTFFCYTRTLGANCGTPTCCKPATWPEVQEFREAMTTCLAAAVDAGLSIALAPHLDDGLGLGAWRNGLLMHPLQNYSGMSYTEFMLFPLADALNKVLRADTLVNFAMQGEMSATVVYHPEPYIDLLDKLRQRILAGHPPEWASNIRLGVSTNFDKICACMLQSMLHPAQFLNLRYRMHRDPASSPLLNSSFNIAAIQQLFASVDFIGISSYSSLKPGFAIHEIESAATQFVQEMALFGVDIPDLIFNKGKKLFFNEYGVGGGTNQNGLVRATTAEDAAAYPFYGVFGAYTQDNDPWQMWNASLSPAREYRHYLYNMTTAYLRSGGRDNQADCPGCKYRVDGVYLWNSASWDITGIYPESSSPAGSYLDPLLVELINEHNALAMGLEGNSEDEHYRLVHEMKTPLAAAAPSPGMVLSGSTTGTGAASNTGGHEHFHSTHVLSPLPQ